MRARGPSEPWQQSVRWLIVHQSRESTAPLPGPWSTLYGVPLTVVAFGGLLTGMVIMLVAGVQSDLKVRRILRDRLMEEDREERSRVSDRDQRELFEGGGEEN